MELSLQNDVIVYKKFKEIETSMEKIYNDLSDDFNYSWQEFLFRTLGQTDLPTIC
jgi:hypothetical protein